MFDALHGADGRPLGDGIRGRRFSEEGFEAVIGSWVASKTGLRLDDEFSVTHGLSHAGEEHKERWKVVGVMRPTGSPHDRAIFIPIESFYHVEGHSHEESEKPGEHEGEHHGDEEHEGRFLSAIGIRLQGSGLMKLTFFGEIRDKRTDVQAAMPEEQVKALKEVVGDLYASFRGVAWLVLVVVLIGILVSLYNTIQGRRREIAILRALGARPGHVFLVIVLEAVLLCAIGGLLGLGLGRVGAAWIAPVLQESYGVRIDASPGLFDLQVLLAVLALGVLAGLLPAWRGLRTPVAENLHPTE
jgi:putative ABC transport system permease protein